MASLKLTFEPHFGSISYEHINVRHLPAFNQQNSTGFSPNGGWDQPRLATERTAVPAEHPTQPYGKRRTNYVEGKI